MRIITANLNGIRSAENKGFYDWVKRQRADVICLQEIKAQAHQLQDSRFALRNHHFFLHDAEKKGYSGVAIYCRREPDRVQIGLDWPEVDVEGRYLQVDFGALSVISLYLPSGTSGELRQQFKYKVMDGFMEVLKRMRGDGREYVICGDWNIAHKEIDLKNWRSNQKNSGFLPEERAWLTRVFDEVGFVDVFRRLNDKPDQYTWWSNRGRAREKNVGWRIDYQIATPGIAAMATRERIYTAQRFSDHAPLVIDYSHEL
jgi:exodeoxyribonuclease-3